MRNRFRTVEKLNERGRMGLAGRKFEMFVKFSPERLSTLERLATP